MEKRLFHRCMEKGTNTDHDVNRYPMGQERYSRQNVNSGHLERENWGEQRHMPWRHRFLFSETSDHDARNIPGKLRGRNCLRCLLDKIEPTNQQRRNQATDIFTRPSIAAKVVNM